MLGKIVVGDSLPDSIKQLDPSKENVVAQVSTKVIYSSDTLYMTYRRLSVSHFPPQRAYTVNPTGFPRICAVDCGLKINQIRCLVKRGARVDVVPWNHPLDEAEYDGLFLSNGPGDPEMAVETVGNIRKILESSGDRVKPIFGICLGHQGRVFRRHHWYP